jgi:acyl dehydratase
VAIDPIKAIGSALTPSSYAWKADDVILYHLGLGAGGDQPELRYTYEEDLHVLPSFGVLPATAVARSLVDAPGMDIDMAGRLHGEHEIEVFGPLPVEASTVTQGRIAAIYDKGKAAIAVLETSTVDANGQLLVVNRYSMFLRGAGGFGGTDTPEKPVTAPSGPATVTVSRSTIPQQALLYRLSGDKNPIHADPEIARAAGFPQPILHGLCTFGMVLKCAVDTVFDGDVSAIRRFRARFAGPLLPGEAIKISMWKMEGDQVFLEAASLERGAPVLTNGILVATSSGA